MLGRSRGGNEGRERRDTGVGDCSRRLCGKEGISRYLRGAGLPVMHSLLARNAAINIYSHRAVKRGNAGRRD